MVAFGDSIVATHAGCFHGDVNDLQEHVPGLDGAAYLQAHCTNRSFKYKWASSFLSLVNATWPHRGHLLVNKGQPGVTWSQVATGAAAARLAGSPCGRALECLKYPRPTPHLAAVSLLMAHLRRRVPGAAAAPQGGPGAAGAPALFGAAERVWRDHRAAAAQLLLQLHLNSTIPPVVFFSMHR